MLVVLYPSSRWRQTKYRQAKFHLLVTILAGLLPRKTITPSATENSSLQAKGHNGRPLWPFFLFSSQESAGDVQRILDEDAIDNLLNILKEEVVGWNLNAMNRNS